jgi:hypothetical protein
MIDYDSWKLSGGPHDDDNQECEECREVFNENYIFYIQKQDIYVCQWCADHLKEKKNEDKK